MRKLTIEEFVAKAKKLQDALKKEGIENVVINIGVSEVKALMQDDCGYDDAEMEVKRQTRRVIGIWGQTTIRGVKEVLKPYKVALNMGIIKEIWNREDFRKEFGIEIAPMAWTRWVKDTTSSSEYKPNETRDLERIYSQFERVW